MGPNPFVGAAVAAAVLAPSLAGAEWNNQPYDYRGGGAGMSSAYRQAIIDQQLTGREPRNLVRSADGRLLTVIEQDNQAFLAEPEPNWAVRREAPAAGVRVRVGSVGGAAAIDGWTAMVETLRPVE